MRPARSITAVAVLVCALLVAGCGGSRGGDDDDGALRVLAGSELKDVQPLLEQLEKDTGVKLELEFTGTLEGAERLAQGEKPAMAWYPSSRYLDLLTRNGPNQPVASERTMVSPVVIGVKHSVARRFGWDGGAQVTWRDIADKAQAGAFKFGMTNPAASNSGFSALVGVASAFAGTGNALTSSDIDKPALKEFFKGQTLTAGSSGFLADAYVRDQGKLDGIVNYESVLLSLNAAKKLGEPLELIYPRDGIVTADYPLLLTDPARRAEWEKVRDWLRRPETQKRLMETTARRPILPQVRPDRRFPTTPLVELPFPASRKVVDDLLIAYLDEIRAPAHAIFVLDLSGSMAQPGRLEGLKSALRNLTGADTSATGRFARFRRRERITMITFSSAVRDERDFTVDTNDPQSATLARIRDHVDGFRAEGGTAIFSATKAAYAVAARDRAKDKGYATSIVVMTDGENNEGVRLDELLTTIPREVRGVKTFAIKFGEAGQDELERMATSTGGAVFDATGSGLAKAFKEIRGFQ